MSGAVLVLTEPGGVFVVACFNTDCPEHGDGTGLPPWVSEHKSKQDATVAATAHRIFARGYWQPQRCGSCGQRKPTATPDQPESLPGRNLEES